MSSSQWQMWASLHISVWFLDISVRTLGLGLDFRARVKVKVNSYTSSCRWDDEPWAAKTSQ